MDMRQLREKSGLRTVDVASVLGLADSTVRNWENGRSVPRFEVIKPLMKLYNCNFEELDEAISLTKKSN